MNHKPITAAELETIGNLITQHCEDCDSSPEKGAELDAIYEKLTTLISYQVTRFYRDSSRTDIIATGLFREQAKAICQDPETSSDTATSTEAQQRTAAHGPWFCGFDEERGPESGFCWDCGRAGSPIGSVCDTCKRGIVQASQPEYTL